MSDKKRIQETMVRISNTFKNAVHKNKAISFVLMICIIPIAVNVVSNKFSDDLKVKGLKISGYEYFPDAMGEYANREGAIPTFMAENIFQNVEFSIENLFDSEIRVNDIQVNIIDYQKLPQDISYKMNDTGMGSSESLTYYVDIDASVKNKSAIFCSEGYDFDIVNTVMKGAPAPKSTYVKINGKGMDMFSILFNTQDTGIYTIKFDIEYTHEGQLYHLKTEKWKFIIETSDNISIRKVE